MLFPTTLVGSYPQPEWLIDRQQLAGRFPPPVQRSLGFVPKLRGAALRAEFAANEASRSESCMENIQRRSATKLAVNYAARRPAGFRDKA